MSSEKIKSLENMLYLLEKGEFKFACLSHFDNLHVSMNRGWKESEYFKEFSQLNKFADDLNIAIEPIINNFKNILRQEIANECGKLAGKRIGELTI